MVTIELREFGNVNKSIPFTKVQKFVQKICQCSLHPHINTFWEVITLLKNVLEASAIRCHSTL